MIPPTAAPDGAPDGLPIADYALLSDCHSAALVSSGGSVDWLCFPRFDSPSVFGRLLDPEAGHWSICPSGEYDTRRSYLPGSLVLETQFTTPSGRAMLTDALVFDEDERGHEIGMAAPHVLVRVLEVTDGEVPIDIELAPRPEYGVVRPRLAHLEGGLLVRGGATVLVLSGPEPSARVVGSTARWRLAVRAGDTLTFALQQSPAELRVAKVWKPKQVRRRLEDTVKGWQSWSELHQRYRGPYQEQVHQSGRVLQGLTYRPSGAIVAAPTTSLPEEVGGSRNWDYRYTWVRDASMTMQGLWVAACPDEAGRFLSFISDAAGSALDGEGGLQVMYGVGGEHDLSERQLPHLRGWRGSGPVRVGNDAWQQRQNDLFGALFDSVWCLREQLPELESVDVEFLAGLADAAVDCWEEPDQGIWESRGEPRHYLHSKLMCWVALDRAVRLADQVGLSERAPGWAAVADTIRAAILEHGWNDGVGAFTQSFGSDELDSSALMLAITGFLPATDPRMRSTIEAIAGQLSAPCGLLYRYRNDDGFSGGESTFLLCSYWLAECWALAGEVEAAREVFEHTTAYANDLGLLSEEAEPGTGELLGNFPQGFSHLGLVNAAWAISRAVAEGSSGGLAAGS